MFKWLAKLASFFSRRSQREIFSYWDGNRQRSLDPLVAWRALWNDDECDLARDSVTAQNPKSPDGGFIYPVKDVYEAEDHLRSLVCRVFQVQQYREDAMGPVGLTVGELDDLLDRFVNYIVDLKKKRSNSRTSPPASESTEPNDYAADSITQPASESSSTPIASSDGEPSGQSRPSKQPSAAS